MIRLTCANCQTAIEVDDAFAGGVCRCKHCGAIQTVPKRTRPATVSQTVAGKTVAGDEPKTLYSAKSRAGVSSHPSGLEELAEAVHGSGLTGSGLLNRPGGSRGPGAPVKVAAKEKPASKLPLALAIVAVVLAAGAAAFFALRNPTPGARPADPAAGGEVAPAFAGVPLAGNKIVYVLDRGDATAAYFPALADLTIASVRSLGPDRLFQIVLWDNGSTDAYPTLTPGYATAAEADKLARWFGQVGTGRSTDAMPALKTALDANPSAIILATGKSLQLDSTFADRVTAAVAGRPTKPVVHAFTLGETAPDDPLRQIAKAAGGRFAALDGPKLTPTAE